MCNSTHTYPDTGTIYCAEHAGHTGDHIDGAYGIYWEN